MERQKCVYPAGRSISRWISALLLMAALLVVVSGVVSRNRSGSFQLQPIPAETAVPLEESFDETQTEAVVDLPGAKWYALQVGVFEGEDTAKQSSIAFQKRGAAGFLWQDGRYRVLAAVYPAQEDAQYVRQQLREQHNIDSYLYTIEFPALSIRLTGMKGQLEILQAAFGHANELAVQMQQLSVTMDRQETSGQEALAQLTALQTQMDLVALRLRQRFANPVNATVQRLIECFDDYSRFVDGLSPADSAVTMGMKLKYQTFATLWNIQNVYQSLNDT